MVFQDLRFCQRRGCFLTWSDLLYTLDECLFLVVAFEILWNRKLEYKYMTLFGVYKALFTKMRTVGIEHSRFTNEFILNIGKVVVFSKTNYKFDVVRPGYNKTLNDVVKDTFNMTYLKWNRLSIDYKKFIYLMSKIEGHMIKHLILTYLHLIKEIPINSPDRKYLLGFLLMFGDTQLIEFYQSITWII